jgi:hypothetical protein
LPGDGSLPHTFKFFQESHAVFLRGCASARLVGQMTLPRNFRVFELLDPTIELFGNSFTAPFEICDLRFVITERAPAFKQTEHGADFSGGASGDVEERKQLVGGAAFEAFGNVVRNGECGALYLIAQAGMAPEWRQRREGVGLASQVDGRLPNREVFKSRVLQGPSGNLRSQISDLKSQISDLRFHIVDFADPI